MSFAMRSTLPNDGNGEIFPFTAPMAGLLLVDKCMGVAKEEFDKLCCAAGRRDQKFPVERTGAVLELMEAASFTGIPSTILKFCEFCRSR